MRIIAIAACTLLLGAAPPPESADFVYTGKSLQAWNSQSVLIQVV